MNDTLQKGDYFFGGTPEEYEEIIRIEGKINHPEYFDYCVYYGVIFSKGSLFFIRPEKDALKNPHNFEKFKQKCINTFGS